MHSLSGFSSLGTFTEALIRTLLSLPSAPAVVYMATFTGAESSFFDKTRPASYAPCAGRGAQDAYYPVTSHYGVPLLSYRDLASGTHDSPQGCIAALGMGFGHPPWRVHQLVADTAANFFLTTHSAAYAAAPAADTADRSRLVRSVDLPSPLHSGDQLESVALCTVRMSSNSRLENRPVLSRLNPMMTQRSSGRTHGEGIKLNATSSPGWACLDDMAHQQDAAGSSSRKNPPNKGRPGWISLEAHSVLKVGFHTSDAGSLGITYLKSYEGFSGVRVRIDDKASTVWRSFGKRRTHRQPGNSRELDNGGVLSALWDTTDGAFMNYSLPHTLTIRRMTPGFHEASFELLPFDDPALRIGAAPPVPAAAAAAAAAAAELKEEEGRDAGGGGGGRRGKFKLLGITSC